MCAQEWYVNLNGYEHWILLAERRPCCVFVCECLDSHTNRYRTPRPYQYTFDITLSQSVHEHMTQIVIILYMLGCFVHFSIHFYRDLVSNRSLPHLRCYRRHRCRRLGWQLLLCLPCYNQTDRYMHTAHSIRIKLLQMKEMPQTCLYTNVLPTIIL